VGKVNKLALIGITAPAQPTDEFRAEYFMSPAHNSGYDSSIKDQTIHHISSKEFWILNRTAGSSAVTVTLSWESSRSGGINNLPDLLVARWNGSQWKNEGNGGTTGSLTTGTIQTLSAVSSFSPFTIASSSLSNPLPLRFIAFTARLLPDNTVALQWNTAGEINTGFFEVQRSIDQSGWISITRIPAAGSGSYAYTDFTMTPDLRYYRIKEVDINGQVFYSIIIPVRAATNGQVQVWPNPADTYLYVQTPAAGGTLEITDINGRRMTQVAITGMLTRIDVQAFARGVYVLRIHQPHGGVSIQFLKQ
jgi:hypothetical protein